MRDKSLPLEAVERGIAPGSESFVGSFASDSLYHKALQGTPIHALIASSTSAHAMQIDAITRAGTISGDNAIITIGEEAILSVSAQTFKVLIMLLSIGADQLPRKDQPYNADAIQRGRVIRLSLSEYMRHCKIRDAKTAREQLNTAISALYHISVEWVEKRDWYGEDGKKLRKPEERTHRMRIVEHTVTNENGKPVRNGTAEVWLTYSMAEYLSRAYLMPYPEALYEINTNNHPYSIPFAWKLCALDNNNITNNHPERVGHTTVKTLLKAAKGIPRYESIAHRGNIYDKIIRPFDRDMKELVDRGILTAYYYFDPMGNRVSGLSDLNYQEFSSLSIWYEINRYPDQTPRLEAKAEKKEKAKRNAIRRAKAKKRKEEQAQAAAEGEPEQLTMKEALS